MTAERPDRTGLFLLFRHVRFGSTGPRQAGRLAGQTGNAETSSPRPVSGFPLLSNPDTPDWPSQKKYPRMQLRTVKDLLEEPRRPFEIPDSYRVEKSQGVGKKESNAQGVLEVE